MALTTLRPDVELATSLLEEMLTYMNPDGTFQVCPFFSADIVNPLRTNEVNKKTIFTKRNTDVL